MFLQDFDCDIARYADDNMPYTSDHNLGTILKNCKIAAIICFSCVKTPL